MDKPVGAPHCFGDWEADDAQCQGGLSTHLNPATGTKHWDRCGWEPQCRQVTWLHQPNRIPQNLLPASHLARPAAARAAPAPVPTYQPAQQPAQQMIPYPQAAAMVAPQQQPPGVVMMQHPQSVPYTAAMPVNYHMPSYLSMPQDVAEDGFAAALGKTLLRASLKAAGHSLASFFDQNALPPGKKRR